MAPVRVKCSSKETLGCEEPKQTSAANPDARCSIGRRSAVMIQRRAASAPAIAPKGANRLDGGGVRGVGVGGAGMVGGVGGGRRARREEHSLLTQNSFGAADQLAGSARSVNYAPASVEGPT